MIAVPGLPEEGEWTVGDLSRLPADLRYELIEGRLNILASPTFVHQKICIGVFMALNQNCPPGFDPSLDLSLQVDDRNEPRPDVLVVDPARGWRTPLPIDDALVVVEVVSPSSTARDLRDKVNLYARAGVRAYWVIRRDRNRLVLTERALIDGAYRIRAETDDVFITDVPWKVTIDLPALLKRCIELAGPPPDDLPA